MSSELKITNLKHASSSSNNLVLASDGNVSITNTLSAGTIGGSVAMQSGLTLRNQEYKEVTAISKAGLASGGATTQFTLGTYTYTPKLGNLSGGSKIVFEVQFAIEADNTSSSDGRGYIHFAISGSGITNFTWNSDNYTNFGGYERGGSGVQLKPLFRANTAFFTTTTNDVITAVVKCAMIAGSGNPQFYLFSQSSSTFEQSYAKFMEFK